METRHAFIPFYRVWRLCVGESAGAFAAFCCIDTPWPIPFPKAKDHPYRGGHDHIGVPPPAMETRTR